MPAPPFHRFQLKAFELKNADTFGKSDPYLQISRMQVRAWMIRKTCIAILPWHPGPGTPKSPGMIRDDAHPRSNI